MAKILIVDDDVVNSQLYINKLSSEGHEAELITDGIEAEEKVTQKYDLILLDIMIPGIDGFSLIEHFRKGINKETPILIFTNLVSDKTQEDAKKLGATDVFYKADTTPQQLIEKIYNYIDVPYQKEKIHIKGETGKQQKEENMS